MKSLFNLKLIDLRQKFLGFKILVIHLFYLDQRVSKELKICLLKLGLPDINLSQPKHDNSTKTLGPFVSDLKYLGPLLQAYDDKLFKLECALEISDHSLENIKIKSEKIVEENRQLRLELQKSSEFF